MKKIRGTLILFLYQTSKTLVVTLYNKYGYYLGFVTVFVCWYIICEILSAKTNRIKNCKFSSELEWGKKKTKPLTSCVNLHRDNYE